MTAALPDDLVTEPVGSLEIRWIFPGELETAIASWFTRFPAETRDYEDIYLLDPHLPGLSVKIRARRALEVKAYRDSPAILDVPGRARGPMQSWQKWSFPLAPLSPDPGAPDGWIGVHKTRRVSQFSLAGDRAVPAAAPQAGQPACSVELAEARARGQAWWTLGFEASGPASTLRTHLEATAALIFAQPLPGPADLGPASSCSYAEWLIRQAGPGQGAEARKPLGHRDVLRRRISAVKVTSRSAPGRSLLTGTTVKMNPPCPSRTCLTRTASRPSGSTITSPASTSPARIMASTKEDTTAPEDRFHPGCEGVRSGMWTAGNAPGPQLTAGTSRPPYWM